MYNNKKIALTFTTCKRFELFTQTLKSLVDKCTDFNLIDEIIIVDDHSSEEDIVKMNNLVKNTIKSNIKHTIHKNLQAGHQNSIIILQNILSQNNVDYQFQCEDDWLFTDFRDFITDSIDIIENVSEVAIVTFRDFTNQPKEFLYKIEKKDHSYEYCVHNYDTQKYYGSWPPYTLNPSIHNFKLIYEKVGAYGNVFEHEKNYGIRCFNAGLKIAYFTDKDYITHIGRDISSYALNNTNR